MIRCLIILLTLFYTLSAKEPLRTWTSVDGRTLQAEYISSSAGKVTIKMGTRKYTLPLSRFSPADQQYVASLASKPTPAITKAESRDARTYAKEEKDWDGYLKGGAIVVDFSGDVQVKAPAPLGLRGEQYAPDWEDPQKEQILTAGYALRTREVSNIRLLLTNGTLITVSPLSEMKILTFFQETIASSNLTLQEITEEISPSMVKLEIEKGEMIVETKKLSKSSSMDISTPFAAAGIRGTAFRLRANDSGQSLEVLHGQVDCQQGRGKITSVIGGQATTASKSRIEDPRQLLTKESGEIKKSCLSMGEVVSMLTLDSISKKYESAKPPLEVKIEREGFEVSFRKLIRRPRGKILVEDYNRANYIDASLTYNSAEIRDIEFLKNFNNLHEIWLEKQPISSLKPISYCKQIKRITLEYLDKISNIQPLEDLKDLEGLFFNGMLNIKKPEQTLEKLSNLKRLELRRSPCIQKWSFVESLTNLNHLSVPVSADFSAISRLESLEKMVVILDQNDFQLPSLTNFRNLEHLDELEFHHYNAPVKISNDDISKLVKMLPNTKITPRTLE